jgi:DNA-binding NtrC family response regulator
MNQTIRRISMLGAEPLAEPVRRALEPDNVTVVRANTVQQAVEAPVVLLDADSPRPWQTALQLILNANPSARVVLISRLADSRMWLQVLDRGAYDLLPNPARLEEIRAVVRNAVCAAMRQAA